MTATRLDSSPLVPIEYLRSVLEKKPHLTPEELEKTLREVMRHRGQEALQLQGQLKEIESSRRLDNQNKRTPTTTTSQIDPIADLAKKIEQQGTTQDATIAARQQQVDRQQSLITEQQAAADHERSTELAKYTFNGFARQAVSIVTSDNAKKVYYVAAGVTAGGTIVYYIMTGKIKKLQETISKQCVEQSQIRAEIAKCASYLSSATSLKLLWDNLTNRRPKFFTNYE